MKLLSESESACREKLEVALQEAGEWKIKAFRAQRAAKALKQKAEELAAEVRGLKAITERAELDKVTALNQASAASQQLSLYQIALGELREGKELEHVTKTIRSALGEPEELKQVKEELASSEAQNQALRAEMRVSRSILESKMEKLEAENLELRNSMEELNQRLVQVISDRALRERELKSTLRDTRLQLKVKSKALDEKDHLLKTLEGDSRSLVEELHNESEFMRTELGLITTEKLDVEQLLEAQITQLEDERSDLEIVNAELYQRIAEIEQG